MVGGSVNDSEDVWVKGPEKMSADFIHLINKTILLKLCIVLLFVLLRSVDIIMM